jgi:hypothetical protein
VQPGKIQKSKPEINSSRRFLLFQKSGRVEVFPISVHRAISGQKKHWASLGLARSLKGFGIFTRAERDQGSFASEFKALKEIPDALPQPIMTEFAGFDASHLLK